MRAQQGKTLYNSQIAEYQTERENSENSQKKKKKKRKKNWTHKSKAKD